jgi:peptidoglycan hydrolase-like protein with peptidoglycan-binding domain
LAKGEAARAQLPAASPHPANFYRWSFMMKSFALALVAAAALTAPALAASPSTGSANQPNSSAATQADSGMQNSSAPVEPNSLSASEIKQLQQALNEKGFLSSQPDGVWGPSTKSALEQFQKSQSLPANGELDQQTLSALNVEVGGAMHQGRAATGSGTDANSNATGNMNSNEGMKSIPGNGMDNGPQPNSGTNSH